MAGCVGFGGGGGGGGGGMGGGMGGGGGGENKSDGEYMNMAEGVVSNHRVKAADGRCTASPTAVFLTVPSSTRPTRSFA
jgi:hypothetical protein